jgi:uncharacterized ubiquitin-like protein YukD
MLENEYNTTSDGYDHYELVISEYYSKKSVVLNLLEGSDISYMMLDLSKCNNFYDRLKVVNKFLKEIDIEK